MLDHLHRCLCTWLAPVLCFTAEEAWTARFGDEGSVHLDCFPTLPAAWHDPALAARWSLIRALRGDVTTKIEMLRGAGEIGSSLQAAVRLEVNHDHADLLPAGDWADIAIVSRFDVNPDGGAGISVHADPAPGTKCARCWRVLEEVGTLAAHPALCLRCDDAVQSGLVGRPRAA